MAQYRVPIPTNLPNDHDETPDRIAAFLINRGIGTEANPPKVRVHLPPTPRPPRTSRDSGIIISTTEPLPPAIVIEADIDPTAAMSQYVDTPTPRQLAFTLLRRIVRDIRNPDQSPRTAAERLADVERAIVALVAIERYE